MLLTSDKQQTTMKPLWRIKRASKQTEHEKNKYNKVERDGFMKRKMSHTIALPRALNTKINAYKPFFFSFLSSHKYICTYTIYPIHTQKSNHLNKTTRNEEKKTKKVSQKIQSA